MAARILDGKAVAAEVRAEVAQGVRALAARGVTPGLAVVLVGEDPASQVYVRNKDRAAAEAGFAVRTLALPATIGQAELLERVRALNADPAVHGILIQLPLPKTIDRDVVVEAIAPQKDVDGLHSANVAALCMGRPGLVPCTPAGVIELLTRSGVALEGARACVIGRSLLVGKPLALLLLQRNATVTVCHSRTRDLPGVAREADLLVSAIGEPRLVRVDWIRPGATVVDVGINRIDEGGRTRLVGDVDFEPARAVAGAITPVPGGVGPMTIAMLLANTAHAAARSAGIGTLGTLAGTRT
jgi:methylenetetrahydrofolate dehydrogenase (NADP+)/methenyltetrahydrofolate cyclohydrolase